MEIVFNNVSYSDKKKSQDKLLDSVSLDIISGSITGFINDKCFIDLLLTLSNSAADKCSSLIEPTIGSNAI